MSLMLNGTGVSRGIAIGRVRLLHEIQPRVVASHIRPGELNQEIKRVTSAMHAVITELRELESKLKNKVPAEIMAFFDSHLLMLEDQTLSQPVIELIRKNQYVSEWALAVHRDNLVAMFANIEDPYLRQRAEDVENVIAKVLHELSGNKQSKAKPDDEYVVVTQNLAPADVIEHQHDGMRGLVCTHGGKMSHAAIVARSLRIPAITGAHPALDLLHEGDEVIVDGATGMVVASPDARSLEHYRRVQRSERKRTRELKALRDKPARTRDNVQIELLANVDTPADATEARRLGAEGIGLFRSEALYLNRDDLPDEREQLGIYRRLLRSMHGRPVTLRTMDIWPGMSHGLPQHLPVPEHPALGLRGIRLCLTHPEIFEPQLRAMLRASTTGPIRILLPMISNVTEVLAARTMIERIRRELIDSKRDVAPDIQVGVLIEVPAAALISRMFVPHVDFLAIGTNDLVQYTLAVDREDDEVQYLYDPLHPAVLQLISDVIATGKRADKPVILCGELASDPRVCRLLLGLGLRHLSVHPSSLLEVKDAILRTDISKIASRARKALGCESRGRMERLLDRLIDHD
ncbi:MAG: phosphoenolpyruvate--protein phosphotransferase [Gammaproteobacteria bacterium]|nr:phosphoenolpyruvate--protein phosphotransferase [Gammaproteobacteria bacterium]MDH3769075.1 phosphoenolpyruvate--protein phosphotransferase [Gammaproteobacteria bacterium]